MARSTHSLGERGSSAVPIKTRYRYRLRVSPGQAKLLQAVFDANRFVWNQALGRWNELWQQERLGYSYGEASAELTDWRSQWEWLGDQPYVCQQQVLRDLGRSISAFFDKKNPAGRPRFKKRSRGYATARWTRRYFQVTGTGIGRSGDRLAVLTSAGRVELRVVWSRPLPSAPGMVTVSRDAAGRWWASFTVEVAPESLELTGRSTGLDVA